MNFSRRKCTTPSPPFPEITWMRASSMNIDILVFPIGNQVSGVSRLEFEMPGNYTIPNFDLIPLPEIQLVDATPSFCTILAPDLYFPCVGLHN
jgi:hypothetical protein